MKKSVKHLASLAAAFALFATVLAGCGNSATTKNETATSKI